MSATYERELKGILTGDAKMLPAVSATLSPEERLAYHSTTENPFLVVRGAGSLGADLVALRHDFSFLLEVKSSKQGRIHFSDAPRLAEQIAEIRRQCEAAGVLPIYAFRRKSVRGDAWRLFTLPNLDLRGAAATLARKLPSIAKTPRGNDVLAWDEGLPLARFLELLAPAPRTVRVPVASVATAPG